MKNDIPEQLEKRIDEIGQMVSEEIKGLYQMIVSEGRTLDDIEEGMREILAETGLTGMKVLVGKLDRERRKGKQNCPGCGAAQYWKHYVERQCISTLGEFMIERAYYYCSGCGRGWCPLDEQLGLGRSELSLRAQELSSYLGAFMPFQRAADFLARSGLLAISHDTVNRMTVSAGQELAARQRAEQEAIRAGEKPYPGYEGEQVPEVVYLSGDGVRYLSTEGQGRELKVAAIYQTELRNNRQGEPVPHAVQIDYLVSHQDPETFAHQVDVSAHRRGLPQAKTSVVLQDGAAWLWLHLAPLAGKDRVEIIDFYHAAGYVTDALDTLLADKSERAFWTEILLTCLKAGKPGLISEALSTFLAPAGSLSQAVQDACDYLTNQAHRMHYADYLDARLQIGSGTIESGVKQVASDRLKQAGMRWNPDHAAAVAQVRAAILSCHPRWDHFWDSALPAQFQLEAA